MNKDKKITYQSQIKIPELLPPFNGTTIQPFIDTQLLKRPFMGIDMQPFTKHEQLNYGLTESNLKVSSNFNIKLT